MTSGGVSPNFHKPWFSPSGVMIQRIGFRDSLQENSIFHGEICGSWLPLNQPIENHVW